MTALALFALAVIVWYLMKLIRGMVRILLTAWRMWRRGAFVAPPRGRMDYLPDRVLLSEAEAIERGVTSIGGHHGGLDSMWPL